MDPDLVCPAGYRDGFQQTGAAMALQDMEGRLGRFPFTAVRYCAMAVTNVHAQRVVGGMLIPFWYTRYDGVVNLLRLTLLELHIQRPVRLRRAGKDHHPAANFVQPVNDP